ncbi:hypothetical protein UFOVP650_79 [uncultured Caudovirales phage]|uniref:Uncharacterized protein n=1 Tax=uncultured Caudovirales phage TaxID=2100421 RepID=A0A6J5NDM5_9CAUD|nr:hypothetical protein UFOVP650_79 [uncultured Caudovirales phage]
MTTTKEQLGAVLSSVGTQTLGALVFWSLAGVRIRRDEFRAQLELLQLGEALPADPSPRGALGKAVEQVLAGKRSLIARRLAAGWALVTERVESGVAKLEHVATVVTKDREVVFTYLDGFSVENFAAVGFPSLEQLIRDAYDVACNYLLTADLSQALTNALTGSPHRGLLAGLSLRERTGGLYFINAAQVDRMQGLKALVATAARDCVVNVMTLTGDAENLQQAAVVARQTFAAQLADLRAELLQFNGSLQTDGKQPKDYAIRVRSERFKELKARVELFRDVLGSVASELETQIEDSRAELISKLESL